MIVLCQHEFFLFRDVLREAPDISWNGRTSEYMYIFFLVEISSSSVSVLEQEMGSFCFIVECLACSKTWQNDRVYIGTELCLLEYKANMGESEMSVIIRNMIVIFQRPQRNDKRKWV